MTEGDTRAVRRTMSTWMSRCAIVALTLIFLYPLLWPWTFVALVKIDEFSGGHLDDHPATEAAFSAFSAPLAWILSQSKPVTDLYSQYVRFVFDLFDVSFG